MDKKFRLPKDGFIDGQDVEGHRQPPDDEVRNQPFTQRDEGDKPQGDAALDQDVEAHRARSGTDGDDFTILPSPPSIGLGRSPGHGGELTDDEDTEGHGSL